MPIEILGRRMHHDVRAEGERLGENRRRDGRIDADQRAGGMREFRDRRDVGDLPGRIARRLDPDETGTAGSDRGARGRQIRRVNEGDRMPEPADVAQPPLQSVIHLRRGEDMDGGVECEHDRHRRRHARAEQQRLRAALEGRDLRLGLPQRRVVRTAIDISRRIAVVLVSGIGRREMDRPDQPVSRRLDPGGCLDGERPERQRRSGLFIHGSSFPPTLPAARPPGTRQSQTKTPADLAQFRRGS